MDDKSLKEKYISRLDTLGSLRDKLSHETMRALEGLRHIDRVYFRVKEADSFIKKALNPQNAPPYKFPLTEIEDQVAGRVIVFFREDLDIVKERLERIFNPIEFERRRPPADVEFGYESNHMICIIPPQVKSGDWENRDDLPQTFEVQIRTIFMHAYAEPQHDFAYKSVQQLPSDIRRELAWIGASAWGADQAYQRIYDWSKEVNPVEQ
ncbi:MAG: hypothetical protein WC837_11060 [Bellilinea sp.]